MHWHLLHTPPLHGVENMALDEALLDRARASGEGVVRIYEWETPTISLGRNQTARGMWAVGRLESRGVSIVRRLTGGRAILHHREFTYSVTAPVRDGAGLREDYQAITVLLRASLQHLGVAAQPAVPAGRMPIPASAPCFELPARDELVLDGRKLVASAQVREEGAFLQHGSLLLHDDQGMLGELANVPMDVSPAATLIESLGRSVSAGEFAGAVADAMREVWHVEPSPMHVDACRQALPPLIAKYADPVWTWRR